MVHSTRMANRKVQMGSAMCHRGSSCGQGCAGKQALGTTPHPCSCEEARAQHAAAACCSHQRTASASGPAAESGDAPLRHSAHLVPPDEGSCNGHANGLHKVANDVDDGACKKCGHDGSRPGSAGAPPPASAPALVPGRMTHTATACDMGSPSRSACNMGSPKHVRM